MHDHGVYCTAMYILNFSWSSLTNIRPVMEEENTTVPMLAIAPKPPGFGNFTVLMVHFALNLWRFRLQTCLFHTANCGFLGE